jgi:hypothetical protein
MPDAASRSQLAGHSLEGFGWSALKGGAGQPHCSFPFVSNGRLHHPIPAEAFHAVRDAIVIDTGARIAELRRGDAVPLPCSRPAGSR